MLGDRLLGSQGLQPVLACKQLCRRCRMANISHDRHFNAAPHALTVYTALLHVASESQQDVFRGIQARKRVLRWLDGCH